MWSIDLCVKHARNDNSQSGYKVIVAKPRAGQLLLLPMWAQKNKLTHAALEWAPLMCD